MGAGLDSNTMGEMMAAADTNKDGMVDLAEFKASTPRIGHAVLASSQYSLHRPHELWTVGSLSLKWCHH